VEATVHFINSIIWSKALIFVCLGAGLFFSLRTRFMQIRGFLEMCRLTVKGEKSDAGVSSFQALAMSMAGRMGIGNIAGVATAIAFGGLSLFGYTTKKDLSGFGSFLIMGLIGLIIASVVNLFLASSALSFGISVLGVLIFAGLTAWDDTQKIKEQYADAWDTQASEKIAIFGALSLYLDFINLFQFLMSFLGQERD